MCIAFRKSKSTLHFVSTSRCKWPPNSVKHLQDPITGTYNITLNTCVLPGGETLTDPCDEDYYKQLLALYRGPTLSTGSCLSRMVEMDKTVRLNQAETNYLLFPQMLDLPTTVKTIKAGQQIETVPINNPELHILRIPSVVCAPGSNIIPYTQDLIVLVKSCVTCSERRKNARETYMQPKLWTGFNVKFIFAIGMPPARASDRFHFDGIDVPNPQLYKFDGVQSEQKRKSLFEEADQYKDLLLGEFEDTYYNLTLKMITSYRWISAFCGKTSALYLFIDSEYSLIPNNTMRMVKNIPLRSRLQLNAGTFEAPRMVVRPNMGLNVGVSSFTTDEIPWPLHPPYTCGVAYVVGADLVTDASIAMSFTRYMRIDDVFLGFVWAKLHVPVMKMNEMLHDLKDTSECQMVASLPSIDALRCINWKSNLLVKP